MSIVISDALQQAEQATRSGDHRSAIQTCNQLVKQFPDYAAAYRVLGEAYLGQGQTTEAEQAFAQALMRDPRQPLAYHGLGLIAERQNVLENALAFCQVAWELAPNQPQLREPVIRIATQRFGTDGQAQLTSAALAQIYANTSRLQRAAREYRTALADLPDRVDLKLGLAEALWQLGKDEESADLCRQVLEENPFAVQALIILADIEERNGHDAEAADLRGRIRAIDPDGRVTAVMLANNEHANREALLLAEDAIPLLDETADAVVAERPHIAPAPDFSYQPARAEQPVQDIEDLQPISAEEFGGESELFTDELDRDDDFSTQATTELVTVGDEAGEPVLALEDDAPSIYRDDEDDLLAETAQEDLEVEEQATDDAPWTDPVQETFEAEAPSDDDLDALLAEFGDVEPMGLEEFGAEPEDLERLAAVEQDLLADDDLFAGFDVTQPADSSENEHVRGLASALEEDVAGALDRTGEFQTVEAEPEPEAEVQAEPEELAADADMPEEPDPLSGTGYTTVLRELGDEGFTPFDPLGRPDAQESPAQFADGEPDSESAADEDANELQKLTQDWEDIDDEIARAVPLTTGQTDQLRAADDLGIAPFDFEVEDDTSRLPAYRPFGEEDDELPELDLEDGDDTILAEEPDSALEEAEPEVEPEPEVEDNQPEEETELDPEAIAEADIAAGVVPPATDDLFANLEPFSMEEFEEEEASSPAFSFGALPWETQSSGSAVPSDEDLEQLLTSEERAEAPVEEPAPEPEPTTVAPDWPTRVLDPQPEEPAEPVDWTTAIQDDDVEAETDPATSAWNLPDDWDTSLAVTRQIGDAQDNLADRLTEAELAAQADGEQTDEESSAESTLPQSAALGGANPEHLAADEDLFERSRSAKTDLINQGTIGGDLEFEAEEPQPEPVSEAPVYEVAADSDDFAVTTGSSRDVNTLRASLEAAPHDDELHWWLAEALRERGDITDAYTEYRWIIRHAGHRSDDVIEALNVCIEDEQHAEVGHRLLADIYRRRGQVSLASSHAATAMAVRRRLRG